MSQLENIPVTAPTAAQPQLLGRPGDITRGQGEGVVSHYDVQPTIDIFGAVQGRDLGAVATDIQAILDETAKDVPAGSTVELRGQVQTMNESYSSLLIGLAGAIVLIYLLIVVNFQSWLDPFVIIAAPAGRACRHRLDAVPHRHDAVGAGADRRDHVHGRGHRQQHSGGELRARTLWPKAPTRFTAAIDAGFIRFRPVLMTALAMIIGMVPMALGLGEGGEQNAPLGRAVIGGLIFATCATLFFVPAIFSLVHSRRSGAAAESAVPVSPQATGGSLMEQNHEHSNSTAPAYRRAACA